LNAALDGGARERGAATRPRRCAQRGRLAHPTTTGMRGSVDSDAWAPPKTKPRGDQFIFSALLPRLSPVAVHAAGSRRRRATIGTTTMRLAHAMRASRGSPGRGPGAARAAKGETRRPGEGPAPAKASTHPRTHRLGRADRGERRRLGDSDLRVSLASLDASTWTRIGDEVEAHAQLSLAVDNGVNFVDLGSCDHLGSTRDGMPRSASSSSSSSATIFELTRGRADAYLGSWLRRSRDTRREDLVVAASVPFGAAAGATEGGAKGRRRRIKNLVERTLMAADTDHVDLLQLHYPRRDSSAMHGGDAPDEDEVAALLDLVGDGKARFLGVDDDTRWAALETARLFANPKILVPDGLGSFVESARGEYNLLARDGFECCMEGEDAYADALRGVGLVAHSPLANGALASGSRTAVQHKSHADDATAKATRSRGERSGGGNEAGHESVRAARLVDAYEEVAGQFGMGLGDLALGFVRSRWFVTSVCVRAKTADALGATLAQLYDVEVTEEALREVERVAHSEWVVEEVDRGRRRWSQEL